jgi:hypothetical protein
MPAKQYLSYPPFPDLSRPFPYLARRLERRLLGNVEYFDDYCITHEDERYMKKQYDVKPEQRDNYFVRTYPGCPEKIEMSFNLSTYQPHLRAAGLDIYQTYYLNAK